MNMIPRLFAATGAVILWAYARACRDRNATQRRLARANLLRRVTARPARCADCGRTDGGCDRVITVDITRDTTKLEKTLSKGGRPTAPWDLPPALKGVPPEEIASWAAHFGHQLTPYEQQLAARSFEMRGRITAADAEIPLRTSRPRLDDTTREDVTKALNDAGGEWWREDSGDRYPGRGGW